MEPTNYIKGYVYCVGGKAYYPNFPVRCYRWLQWLIFLPAVVAIVLEDWLQLFGAVMLAFGFIASNARFSPVHGCLVWLPIIGLGIWSVSQPAHAIPLIGWGVAAWVAGCIECRLTLVPHEDFNDEAKRISGTAECSD